MKIITVTDAWHPQVNGVVRTIEATNRELERGGHTTSVIGPPSFLFAALPRVSRDPAVAAALSAPRASAAGGDRYEP